MAPSLVRIAVPWLLASTVWAADSVGLAKRAAGPPGVLPGTWKYQGCYRDANPRTLSGPNYVDTVGMTAAQCIAFCERQNPGFIYAGTEYSQECFCGNEGITTQTLAPMADCSMECKGNATEACGGPNRLSVYWNGEDPPRGPSHNPGTLGYGLLGCYTEGTTGRALEHQQTGFTGQLTIAKCISACKDAGYSYAGAEYAVECFCGNELAHTPTVAPEGLAGCNMPCAGNSSEYCGAGYRLDVYQLGFVGISSSSTTVTSTTAVRTTTPVATTTPAATTSVAATTTRASSSAASPTASQSLSHKPTIGAFTRLGCYTDAVGNRVLLGEGGADADFANQSLDKCAATCTTRGYSLFGVEYGGECWCADVLQPSSTKAADTDCNFICPGNQYQYCGAGDRLELYKLTSLVSTTSNAVSSTTTTTTTRASTTTTTTTTSRTTTTVSPTTTTTTTTSRTTTTASPTTTTTTTTSRTTTTPTTTTTTTVSPTTTTTTTVSPTTTTTTTVSPTTTTTTTVSPTTTTTTSRTTTTTTTTSSPTTTTTTTTSRTTTTIAPTTTTTTSRTTTTTTTTTTTSASPNNSGLPQGWKYAGCYSEGTGGRALSYQQPGGTQNSVQNCIARCISLGYSIAGMEYSEQCFCDNALYNGAATIPETRCNMACSGNPDQKCGAGDVLSLYNTGDLKIFQPPKPQTTGLPGSWEYAGCWTDSVVNARALGNQRVSQNNTATFCLSACSKYGYMSGGMQYGEECYCGDHDTMVASGSTQRPESECNIACTGNKEYICGGGNRNSYYRWTGTTLNTFNRPTGPAAGSYEFFIPGVVIPLITTLGINDKVVFMEKSGTGAPNTTGTYELDLTLTNDYIRAFRPLSVKTDIFCAAGVTLPDKAGRQLNIGGWSGRSTYGVRLYTPSGSDGVAGTTNWQEDETKVSLLDGRWYPSAINLANGSVLVVGGETGSNASPTPTVEILPLPAGGYSKYMDWLERTDPNNLYPFLWVLPSGGIFIMYYNEARILDERTLDTIKLLPKIPGSVNNDAAGRTYPLEGTGVILPLYSPFTAPATFMACGGSTEGPGFAIDNCVSVQPEVADPVYTIERMPSKRVMSCIAALPDGTYLIVNGAKQGVAGFGLATDPNLEAVLYDPTKPVGQRMSIMATTTIARLYHSEAILLPDGRVLISGSNPEDGKNPEEYRVEVFNPPYALSGQAPPTFTVGKKDWAYNEAITISASLPSGNTGSVRVSMMSAVSSTHGNSMGQRTLFLAVGCSGSGAAATCTVTTPPSAHVAPPGWYQIFLLDGARPGRGKWIRIGGAIADAAGIGNWPQAAGFTVPGLGAVV